VFRSDPVFGQNLSNKRTDKISEVLNLALAEMHYTFMPWRNEGEAKMMSIPI